MANRRSTGFTTIYALADPETGEIRYVGKTMLVPRDRLREHVRDSVARMAHTHLSRWLRTLDREPTQLVLEECSHEDGCASERRWIAELREQGVRLTNLTDGGEGVPGFKLSVEHRAKIAEATRRRMATPEAKEMMRRVNLAKRDPSAPRSRYRPTDRAARDRDASKRLRQRWEDDRNGMLAVIARARDVGDPHSPAANAKRAESMKKVWADPVQRAQRSAAISAAKRRK